MKLEKEQVRKAVLEALKEDGAFNDITTESLGIGDRPVRALISAKEPGVICGAEIVKEVFRVVSPDTEVSIEKSDSSRILTGDTVLSVSGRARGIIAGERTALNFLSHLSGISTLTHRYAEAIRKANPGCFIYDTRKTHPGLRVFEKYAVLCGGGRSHRGGLSDQILIKENHLAAGGLSVREAVEKARSTNPRTLIEIEVESEEELNEAVESGADIVMLDDFPLNLIKRVCPEMRKKNPGIIIEVSGGVSPEAAGSIAAAGADRISAGRITASAPSLDFSLLIKN